MKKPPKDHKDTTEDKSTPEPDEHKSAGHSGHTHKSDHKPHHKGGDVSSESEELQTLRMQVEALTEAMQRERADATNVRRRAEEDKARMGNYYKAMIIKALLPAIDNLDRALRHAPKELVDHDYVKGVQGIAKQFEKAFADLGVERIKTVGEVFDPVVHEAVSMEDGDGNTEVVTEELQAGYRTGDEIIRHAMVRVKMEAK